MADPDPTAHRSAQWGTRIGAWLVDVLVVGAVATGLGDVFGTSIGLLTLGSGLDVGQLTVLLFAYWTLFESSTGQSPGKMALELAVIDDDGHPPDLVAAAIQSFGKAFLLPLDVLLGLLATPKSGRRLSHRLSGTRVVELTNEEPRQRGPAAVEA